MPGKKHSKESIVQVLQNVARAVGANTLSKKQVSSHVPLSSINYHFGSLGNALEAAGLRRVSAVEHLRSRGVRITEDELFASILRLEEKLGKEPGYNQYLSRGDHSVRPFTDRFGNWPDVLAYYRKWKLDHPRTGDSLPHASVGQGLSAVPTGSGENVFRIEARKPDGNKQSESTSPHLYGEEINFRSLRHAPTNELEVIFLFALVSKELGFNIEAIRAAYPDCEAKLKVSKKNLWSKVRIEFEFRASNFREHAHDAASCDYIVCWENDWPECPLPVIELKKEIMKLPH